MPQQLSQEKIRRMITGGSVGSSGGGSFDPSSMAGMASQAWVNENFVSKAFWNQAFEVRGTKTTTVGSGTPTVDTNYVFGPNEEPGTTTTTEGGVTTTVVTVITNIKAKFGFWTEQYLSALGQNSGGGGGGVTLNEPLESINGSGMSAPGATEDGKTIVWDNTQQKWKYGAAGGGGGGGTVTSITAGTGLTGGTITTSGTISLAEDTVTAIGKGVTAYGWGNHATEGYLKSVAFSDLTSHPTTLSGYGITDAYTKTEADAKYMTIVAFENLFNALNSSGNKVSHPYSSGVDSIKALVGLWTEQYLSALGQNSGGGGVTFNEPLASINSAGLGTPTASGQVITWNGSQWIYSIPGGGGGGGTGTVTSITAGTGLSGGTITTMGTIALSTETQTNIGYGMTAYGWGNHANAGYLTSVSFSDLTSHPTTLSGYGITDAYISSGTIYLGSNSITPLTSFTETDPTVPAWAKASNKPSYSFSEITGTIASSQLPTLYWANVEVSSSSSDTAEPKMKSLHLYGTSQFGVGGKLKFGDGDYVYLTEASDDKLTIYGKSGIYMMGGTSFKVGIGTTSPAKVLDVVGDINATLDITTAQAVNARNIELSFTSPFIDFHHASSSADYTSRLITTDYGTLNLQSKTSGGTDKLSGLVVGANYDGSFIQIGNIKIVYESANNALKIIKSDGTAANLYATGGVAALGTT